jgi:hypothetical protein
MKVTISLNPSSGDKKTTYCLQGASYYYLLSSKMTHLNLYIKVAFQIHKGEIWVSDLCWLCCNQWVGSKLRKGGRRGHSTQQA